MLDRRSKEIPGRLAIPRFRHFRVSRSSGRARPPAAPGLASRRLHIGVASAEHGGEPGGLFFAPAPLAWPLKMPVVAHHFQGPFAVNLLLQPPQRLFHPLALPKLYLGQNSLTSSPATSGQPRPSWPTLPLGQAAKSIFGPGLVNGQIGDGSVPDNATPRRILNLPPADRAPARCRPRPIQRSQCYICRLE